MRYVSVRTAYICMYAYSDVYVCVICTLTIMYPYNNYVCVQQLCTRTTIMYSYNNYVLVQQLCTRTIIMYACNNYERVQQLCTRTTIMYAYIIVVTHNNVCVKRRTCAYIRSHAQAYPRAHTSYFLEKYIAPPLKKLKWRPWLCYHQGSSPTKRGVGTLLVLSILLGESWKIEKLFKSSLHNSRGNAVNFHALK